MKTEDTTQTSSQTLLEGADLTEMNFSAFVFSLSHTALMQLEEAEANCKKGIPMLTVAKQTINILEILKEKTRGNLERDEEKLLSSLLFDLRMQYLDAKKKCCG